MSRRWTAGFKDRLFGAATLALLAASLVSGQRGDGPQSRADQKDKSMALAMPSISSPIVGVPVAFAVTPPLAELTDQASMPEAMPSPIVGFDGLSQQDNLGTLGFQVYPPDTDGQAGPNHFVQAVNLVMRVFSKTGTPLTAPVKVSSLFAALGGLCAANDDGNPIVLHDQLADRWLITQPVLAETPHQCIAISTTGDPTGSYFLYDYVLPGTGIDVYPKFGMWPDAYYMANLQYNQTVTAYLGQGVFAFDRSKMLEGNPGASFIYFNLGATHFGMLPSDMDGLTAPPPGTPNYFAMMGTTTSMRLFGFQANFADPSASTFTELTGSPVTVAVYDPVNPTGRADIEQPSPATTSMYLESFQDRLMYRLAYRNFVSHESLVVTHTVNVGPAPTTVAGHRAAVRYYEVRRSLPGGNFTVPEQATFGPDTDNRWMGSAAMDSQGNIAVGYSVSSTTTFPSIRYAGRLASDPPNGLFQGEATLIAGSGVQRGTANRWGEHSALTLDPTDDCTFWYTTEYYTAASQAFSTIGWLTRIGTFKFPSCTAAATGTITGVVRNAGTNAPVANALVTLNPGGFSTVTDANGVYSRQVPPGTYTATASQSFYSPASVTIVVTNGATTTQDFFLSGISNLIYQSSSPSALDTAFCSNLSVTLLNNGAASATGISATLSSAVPGVVIEQATSAYANIAPGSTGVNTIPFKVRFSSAFACVVNVSFTLTITTSAGVVSLPFTIGTTAATPATQFDNNTPLAIPDLSTVESTIAVSGQTAPIHKVTVSFHLTHTFTGDLDISLVGPDNTTVELTSDNGLGGDNFGTGCSPQSSRTTFDQAASALVTEGSAPFVGTFRPEGSLATFTGKSGSAVNGTWKLRVTDDEGQDIGTLQCWSLVITTAACVKGGSCAPPTTSGDFDVDGRSDIAVFRPSTGQWFMLHSGTNYSTSSVVSWGLSTDVTVAGDYDGDAKTDLAVFRASVSSTWFIRQSSTNYTTFASIAWGTAGDIPVPGDYDADGRTDPAVYRPSTRQWFILQSSTNYATFVMRVWGFSTDVPAPADYDGDGKTDLGVYRPSTGQWLILKSSTDFNGFLVLQFGNASDIPVQGDYDGDRKADVAVFRGSTGQWFILRSSTNYMAATTIAWGMNGDAPVPADYDGDDRLDLAIYRPSNGAWYLLRSASNYTTFSIHNFGSAGDRPVLHRP
jgi:subtilisin-like proprotein convertase family protein